MDRWVGRAPADGGEAGNATVPGAGTVIASGALSGGACPNDRISSATARASARGRAVSGTSARDTCRSARRGPAASLAETCRRSASAVQGAISIRRSRDAVVGAGPSGSASVQQSSPLPASSTRRQSRKEGNENTSTLHRGGDTSTERASGDGGAVTGAPCARNANARVRRALMATASPRRSPRGRRVGVARVLMVGAATPG